MCMYEQGLVSVIIPTFGRLTTLERAIKSVIKQTYNNIEILVVDDNEPYSEDSNNVKILIEKIACEKLQLVTQEKHINGAAARNTGIKQAKGEFIAFLDDDDLFLPQKIEKQVEFLNSLNDSYGGVSTKKIYIKNNKIDGVSETWKADDKQSYKIITRKLNVSTCTLLIRHICLDETGYFDEDLQRNQEVQFLGFFTSKYKVELLNEYLTLIDCSDITNRSSAAKILDLKKDYFKAIAPITSKYSKHKQKVIIAYNMLEVVRVYWRDGHKLQGMLELLNCIKYPTVFIYFMKFIKFRINYKLSKKKYDLKILDDVLQLHFIDQFNLKR